MHNGKQIGGDVQNPNKPLDPNAHHLLDLWTVTCRHAPAMVDGHRAEGAPAARRAKTSA